MQIQLLERQVNEDVPATARGILARAREIVPLLRENSARVEESRCLTVPVVNLLRNSGVFRAAMPQAWGGPELTSMQQSWSRPSRQAMCLQPGAAWSGWTLASIPDSFPTRLHVNCIPVWIWPTRDGFIRKAVQTGYRAGSR
ncbi:MAG: hypothetical protein CBARDMAM_5935 [uncultured Caballeronia sp.]|nr:MAG: hypothetical protein CBARDMAM_5935 [uncultured Caballeronia sp.]